MGFEIISIKDFSTIIVSYNLQWVNLIPVSYSYSKHIVILI